MSNPTTNPANRGLNTTFYGSKLFLKFFFWFWMTLVLTGILVTAYGYFYHFEPEKRRMFSMGQEIIEGNGKMLVNAYEKLGKEGVANFPLPGNYWLFDANLNILVEGFPGKFKTRREPQPWEGHRNEFFKTKSAEIKAVASKIFSGKAAEFDEIAGEMLLSCLIISESNKKYAIINHLPSKGPGPHPFLIGRFIEILPIFLLVTGVLCIALTRYIVKPLVELREASRSFALGKFTARVTGNTLNRFDEIGDLAVDFNDMAEKIENTINSQRRLFGDISHELRSPLARLQVSVELLQKRIPAAEHHMLARIEKEINRMNALIEEVLQFSKLESGSVNGDAQRIELHTLLKQVCNDANFEGHTRNCKVGLAIANEITMSGIPQLIERAIENILRNALRYSPENSEVTVTLLRHDKIASITIADKGPGVSESELQKIFTPFYRCQEDRNPQNGGIGLGLAIAQRAISLHHGQIILRNRPEGGLIAEINLPVADI